MRRFALMLSFAATLYGGVLLGLGNWLDNVGTGHQHHHDAIAAAATLPAHCVFCIDGVSPAPPAVHQVVVASGFIPVAVAAAPDVDLRIGTRVPFQARGPPSSIAPTETIRAQRRWRTLWTARPPDICLA